MSSFKFVLILTIFYSRMSAMPVGQVNDLSADIDNNIDEESTALSTIEQGMGFEKIDDSIKTTDKEESISKTNDLNQDSLKSKGNNETNKVVTVKDVATQTDDLPVSPILSVSSDSSKSKGNDETNKIVTMKDVATQTDDLPVSPIKKTIVIIQTDPDTDIPRELLNPIYNSMRMSGTMLISPLESSSSSSESDSDTELLSTDNTIDDESDGDSSDSSESEDGIDIEEELRYISYRIYRI